MPSNAGGISASDASSLKSKFQEGRKKKRSRKIHSVLHPDGGEELCAAERMRLLMGDNEKGSWFILRGKKKKKPWVYLEVMKDVKLFKQLMPWRKGWFFYMISSFGKGNWLAAHSSSWVMAAWLKVTHEFEKVCHLSVQFSSIAQSCPTLCNPCSMLGFPVHHQLLEPTQTHVHQVGDAIQPSHPLSSPSPPAFNVSQHQGLFQWVSSSHQVAKVLELQYQSFQWVFRNDFL